MAKRQLLFNHRIELHCLRSRVWIWMSDYGKRHLAI